MVVFYPKKILESENADLFKPIYARMFLKNQQFSSIICGKPGAGKSYLALALGEMFYPNFKPRESVCFTAQAFADKVAEDLPKAYPIILDDAGLSLHSAEALKKEVRNISKTLQSIRHKNLVIILTIPSLALLAKSARVLSDYYFEPLRIDWEKQATITKFQHLSFNPINGKMYRSNAIRFVKREHWGGYQQTVKQKILAISVPKASDEACCEYDAWKKERMKEFDTNNAASLKEERKEKVLTVNQLVAKVRAKRDSFVSAGKVSSELIMQEFGVGMNKARSVAKLVDIKQET